MKPQLRQVLRLVPVRFSLRLLLIAVSALAIWLGWWANSAHQQRKARGWVQEHGGIVVYDYQWQKPWAPGTRGGWQEYAGWYDESLPSPTDPLRQWLGDDFFLTARGVGFRWWDKAEIADSELHHLTAFPALRTLSFYRMGIGDAGLTHIARLKNLRTLNLDEQGISDAGLEQLAKLEHLEALFLRSSQITDEGLRSIARLRNLRMLRIPESSITGEGLAYLRDLPHLEYVALLQSPINAVGLENAKTLHRLKELDLQLSGVSNDEAQALRGALPGCKVSN
jgi:Leucine Rich repeat